MARDGGGSSPPERVVSVVSRLPSAVEGVDGVTLEAEGVGVDGGGDADAGVAEEFLDCDEV